MRIEINCEDRDSSQVTKSIVNKILDIVDNHPTKEKEEVNKEIMKSDEILVPVFLSLIKKNAIICYEETVKGKTKTLLKTENRNSIFYAISRLKDIFNEETLKTWFEYSFFNGDKKEPKAFNRLKPLDVNEAFELYLKGDFSDFCSITDYCCALYKKYEERKSRMPNPNPTPIVKNVIYQPYCKRVQENKQENVCINETETNQTEFKTNDESNVNLCHEATEVITMSTEETKQEKTDTKTKSIKKQSKSCSSKSKKQSDTKQSTKKPSKPSDSKSSNTVKSKATTTSKKSSVAKDCKTGKTNKNQSVNKTKKQTTVKQTKLVKQKTEKDQNVNKTNIKTKSSKNSSRQKLKDINVKLSKTFYEFIKIAQDFVDVYAKQNEDVPFDVLLNNVKTNESYVDKIRKELKKLSTVKKRIMNIKNDEK